MQSQHQHPLEKHPTTLLSIAETAPLINKKQSTLQVDVTRRPETLPVMTRPGGRVFFQVKDILDWLESGRVLRQGRETRQYKKALTNTTTK